MRNILVNLQEHLEEDLKNTLKPLLQFINILTAKAITLV